MPSQSKAQSKSASLSILLIEEYDALAAAFTSALKKFAPTYAVTPVPNFAQAEVLATETKPALLIVDFDPPGRGLTDLLYRLRDVSPETRVLVIGAKVPKEIALEFRSLGVLHFVGKPFEILDFGAAVQALLGPGGTIEAASIQGGVASIGLPDIVLAQCVSGGSITLSVKGKNGKSGDIQISAGQLSHALFALERFMNQ